ncbi:MAG: cytochrome bc complex cytochrome b subunit [Dokdonella sp.]|jgi:ubiquinol-cytochrome c reductase cytochrome b subunit|uniref:cytochrome b n=1 Tax=Dokdonella sp. TaxID=2291710 RepID=UPI001B56E022|nr:cytochrome bc complex cytochrome b subunit [Dokdonella sp.]MCC6441695.1 cytochrome bc complex cytochrome b subunit [Rhodanobacteraceae bacterium]MBK8122642.1 cytochrome bc complex cytochrome b subunit [Dokdonella sp.]MBP6325678.1 cytochrome bc complex cytochrome b subunit [Dokdonella sp.]MBP6328601.1 cytochrome bc complex cytochrome b subunit [Dokdonella sp.]HPW04465.1 cytochrome bc complex cytochrome b subunit [Dokdonella sp.]
MANRLSQAVTGMQEWFNDRAPSFMPFYRKHMTEYYAPKNFNIWYIFGVLSMVVLVNQIVTGIFLTMYFKPSAAEAFASVEYIMRDVDWGWLIRYMHSTGASAFFVVVYIHMFRGVMYGSYKKPRELVWLLGMLIYLVLMAEAFMGYVLPWGQMSFWGAKVIISLFGAIPYVGGALTEWIMGDYLPSDATLNRFFALHVIALPLVLLLLVVLHIFALHEVGSNNPDGVEIKKGPKGNRWSPTAPTDGIPFHPYFTVKDTFYTGCFLLVCAFILFFQPTFGGLFLEHDNFIEANRLVTPEHIKPTWYYTPFYAMLRVVPDKLLGVVTMFSAIIVLFFLPWIDRGKVKSWRYRGLGFRVALVVLGVCFVWLGKIGAGPGTDPVETIIGRILTIAYFGFFVFLWVYTAFGFEKTKPVPERVTGHD